MHLNIGYNTSELGDSQTEHTESCIPGCSMMEFWLCLQQAGLLLPGISFLNIVRISYEAIDFVTAGIHLSKLFSEVRKEFHNTK